MFTIPSILRFLPTSPSHTNPHINIPWTSTCHTPHIPTYSFTPIISCTCTVFVDCFQCPPNNFFGTSCAGRPNLSAIFQSSSEIRCTNFLKAGLQNEWKTQLVILDVLPARSTVTPSVKFRISEYARTSNNAFRALTVTPRLIPAARWELFPDLFYTLPSPFSVLCPIQRSMSKNALNVLDSEIITSISELLRLIFLHFCFLSWFRCCSHLCGGQAKDRAKDRKIFGFSTAFH